MCRSPTDPRDLPNDKRNGPGRGMRDIHNYTKTEKRPLLTIKIYYRNMPLGPQGSLKSGYILSPGWKPLPTPTLQLC